MRKAMQSIVRETISNYDNTALLLIDIGGYPFRDLLEKNPQRAKNIGIFEPGTVSIAAGLALSGIVPIVYGISPFIVQRSLEQLKLDFVYQKVGGNFITTGAAYDFSTLGYSHYCPEDVATLRLLPGMEIVTPGSPSEFESLFRTCRFDGKPTYFRMTDHSNKTDIAVELGKAAILKRGKSGTVVAVAEQLDATLEAAKDLDVTILYYSSVAPFDKDTLRKEFRGGKVFFSTPFYTGTLYADAAEALNGLEYSFSGAEIPLEVLRTYGVKAEKDAALGLDAVGIRKKLIDFLSNG